jgi:hypothetical protein
MIQLESKSKKVRQEKIKVPLTTTQQEGAKRINDKNQKKKPNDNPDPEMILHDL